MSLVLYDLHVHLRTFCAYRLSPVGRYAVSHLVRRLTQRELRLRLNRLVTAALLLLKMPMRQRYQA